MQEEIAGLSTSKQAVREFMPLCGQMAEGPVATIVLNWQAREDLRRDMIFGTTCELHLPPTVLPPKHHPRCWGQYT